MLNYYRRFLPHAAETQIPLLECTKGNKKKDNSPINWTPERLQAFVNCKEGLANAALLAHPLDNAKICLMVDASDHAIGGVVNQLNDNVWEPLAFFSRRLSPAELNYSTYDRELLSAYAAIKHFQNILEARVFTIFTDHKPLVFAFNQKNEKASPRQLRHLDYISQFSTDIQHISGKDNIVADTLSRINSITLSSSLDFDLIAKQQETDEELKKLKRLRSGIKLVRIDFHGKLLTCDVSKKIPRPYIPALSRKTVFDHVHKLSHSGAKATAELIKKSFIWPAIDRDVRMYCKSCISCQRTKIQRHNSTAFESISTPSQRFEHVHIDLVGSLPPSDGYTYVLTCIDRFTRWPEAIPLSDIKAETVAKAFYLNWIARFGVPLRLTTDQGKQFESELFMELNKLLGTQKLRTTAYHPQANGMVERWHRTFKNAIKCHANNRWIETLPTIMLGLRSIILENINASPAELVYGTNLRLPCHFFEPVKTKPAIDQSSFVERLKETMNKLRPVPSSNHSKQKVFIHKEMETCTHVFVRRDGVKKPLQSNYDGPFEIVSRQRKHYTVKIKGKNKTISLDRLKPMFIAHDVSSELTPSSTKKKKVRFATQSPN